jgi:capsule polysaccharide export protein KpsE/RkpR
MSSNPFPIPRRVAASCAWIARGSHVAIPPLAGLVLGWLVFALTTPIYTSTITFFPPSAASNGMSGVVNQLNALSVLSGSTQSKTLAEQYVSMLKSRCVADAMSAKFDLPHVYGKTLPEDVRRTLAQRTGIYMSSRSELIEVSVDDTDRQRVAKMASYYIDALSDLLSRVAVTDARQRRIFLDRQVDETRSALERVERQLRGAGVSPSAAQLEPSAAVGMAAQMKAAITAQEIRLSALRSVAGRENPATLAATSELDALKRRLADMQAGEKSAPGDAYTGLYRDYKYNSALLELLMTQLASARLDEAREGQSLQIVDFPAVPNRKTKPVRVLYLGAGFGLGLALSATAWFVARMSRLKVKGEPA